ncbi:hypothetical protein AVEN_26003-1 [Araneus ventricosus]|uniref:Uncharacterized protein n=1 Tax=Araneus ventricosus TaxID=182803 RepID=A0A4Y2E3K9_ARAVE|nr:hypothetical protein AVEN_26003-1 [Araneus ventricosus]
MEEVLAVLENYSSTTTPLIEDFPKTTASQDILEEISPLPSSSNTERKRKKLVQVKRSKLITSRKSKEDLKMNAKMELKSEEEKREGGASSVQKPLKKTGISVGFVKAGLTKIAPILKEATFFYECDVYVTKKM